MIRREKMNKKKIEKEIVSERYYYSRIDKYKVKI